MNKTFYRYWQDLETLANEGMRLALRAATPDKELDIILEYLGKALRGERTYIFEKNETSGDDNTYEWVANGITPEKDNLQNLPPEICANWYRQFCEDKNIIIEDLEDIKESDPLQYDNLKRQDIHSLVVVPLYDDTKNIGFYGVDNPHGESFEYTQNFLQIMGHFIVSSLKRRDLLKQLQNMSYSDQLTKLGNRFAMERYLEETIKSGSLGVVYCDITGLKRVNDTKGHKAGDELLALCPQIEKHVLEQKTSLLREVALKNSVVMAVGSDWQEVTDRDIDKVLSVAEQRMYEDKALYYKKIQSNIAQ